MKINSRFLRVFVVIALAVGVLVLACTAPAEPDVAVVTDEVMADAGLTILEARCTSCHNLERTTSKSKTYAAWDTTVERMIEKGASVSDEELPVLLDYLAENHGTD